MNPRLLNALYRARGERRCHSNKAALRAESSKFFIRSSRKKRIALPSCKKIPAIKIIPQFGEGGSTHGVTRYDLVKRTTGNKWINYRLCRWGEELREHPRSELRDTVDAVAVDNSLESADDVCTRSTQIGTGVCISLLGGRFVNNILQ